MRERKRVESFQSWKQSMKRFHGTVEIKPFADDRNQKREAFVGRMRVGYYDFVNCEGHYFDFTN